MFESVKKCSWFTFQNPSSRKDSVSFLKLRSMRISMYIKRGILRLVGVLCSRRAPESLNPSLEYQGSMDHSSAGFSANPLDLLRSKKCSMCDREQAMTEFVNSAGTGYFIMCRRCRDVDAFPIEGVLARS